MNRSARGFTLIELLVVVAVIGIIVAIAIPNILNALDRGKQKRTMADLRSIATAVEQYSVDLTIYPTAGTMNDLAGIIEPVYMRDVPRRDAWGFDFVVVATQLDYTLGSGGKDGGALNYVGGETSQFSDAIIFSNGQFVQWPEGTQR